MTYPEALSWVHSLGRMGKKPGLDRMRKLLAALGDPQRRLRVVHVAGTNGKGSVVVMLASVLRRAGYRVGYTLSPYVLDFRERFMLNGEMISEEELAALLTEVRGKAGSQASGELQLIEFEVVTAAALLWFARKRCDIVVLETGIGGRLDCTNVVEDTLVACITRIGFDHTEILGNTLTEIAAEKCGIMREGRPVVSYPAQPSEAADEIARQAKAIQAPLIIPDADDIHYYIREGSGVRALLPNRANYGGYDLDIPFPGRHQALNAAMVVEAALALWRQGLAIEDEHIVDGIATARIPARIEIVSRDPPVIIDGAHNTDGALALAATLAEAGVKNLVAVCGIVAGKQADKMLSLLAPYVRSLYTVAPATPRALPAEELARMARRYYGGVHACGSVADALALAKRTVGDGGMLVFGSLYLASEARALLVQHAE